MLFVSSQFKMGKTLKFSNDADGLQDSFELLFNGSVVDTVLTSYGLKQLKNNTIAYFKVNSFKIVNSQYIKEIYGEGYDFLGNPYDLIIRNKNGYFSLKDLVPEYSSTFSMSIFENDKVYFWGVNYNKELITTEMSAISLNYITKEIIKVPVYNHLLETDYNDILGYPKIKTKDVIIFKSIHGTFNVNFKLFTSTKIKNG